MIKYNKKKILIDKEKNDLNRTDSSLYNISVEECQILCGLLPDHISDIARIIHQNPQHIFEFFTICRQNMNQRAAAVFFGYKTHASISSHFNQILGSLSNDFVPIYIGSSAFTRTDIQRNTPDLFKKLFPGVVGIIDGIYLFCQKSKCFELQKKTWSEHKKRNLIKIMGVQFANGRWFDLMGPFYADGDHNDASIWNYVVKEDIGRIHDIFDERTDEFIGDRGFRNVDNERFTVRIPPSLAKDQVQLSTQDANTTRKITKLRNCIEHGFGRLKKWRIIGSVIDNNLISKVGSLLRILGAIDNKYFESLFAPADSDEQDVEFIKHPLTLETIRDYGLDDYALKLAIPYLQHATAICVKTHKSKQYSNVIKVEGIKSRYSKKSAPKHHIVFLQFDNDNWENDYTLSSDYDSDYESLLNIKCINSYCSCKSGARTLYCNIKDVPIPGYSAKLIILQQNITDLQPFNQHRREQKSNKDDIHDTNEDESSSDEFLEDNRRKKKRTY
ncbi:unnamed protein product [Rotaria sordida]|uniref:DDE Tnp4 domain-containing protein n=1 Tax=Rotaria sordida TaxID=392033 RepID=A0A818RV58_9BILA|nr:unnamed protein product [Rotaria sordida]CAF3660069.1 unnamed protein product [Rotaria sordida]